nr:cytochrome c oxidase subunit 2 [Meghimatium bilineatum]
MEFVGTWTQINLLDPMAYLHMEMNLFHDHAMILCVGILFFVLFVGASLLSNRFHTRTVHEAQTLEFLWTILPAGLLVWLALPSLRLLYLLDEQHQNSYTVKAIGHQWYWSYELANQEIAFDSYMLPENSLSQGMYRLLEVDKRVLMPYGIHSLLITTSADVIHAWALPSAGLKVDAVPGRLNSMNMNLNIPGIMYGQCSEICGANHAFMPIVVESVNVKDL